MSTTSNRETLDELFVAWSDDQTAPQPRPLATWMAQNPENAGEIGQWAADAPVFAWAETQSVSAARETRTLEIGRDVLAQLRARLAPAPVPAPIADLYAAAKALEIKPRELAARLGVGMPVLAMLRGRMIQASTLPNALMQQIADVLQTSADSVQAYFSQPPTLAASAMYKSDGVPQTTGQDTFATAVRACADMSDEQKAFWLAAK